jgi:hypothetical protein
MVSLLSINLISGEVQLGIELTFVSSEVVA